MFVSINIWLHHFGLEDGLKVSLKVGLKVWELKHQCGELSSPQTLKICRIEIFNLLYPHFDYLLIAYSFNTVFERELVKSEQIVSESINTVDGGGKISHLSKFNDHIIACGNLSKAHVLSSRKGFWSFNNCWNL